MRLLAAILIALPSLPALAATTDVPAGETQHSAADPLIARHLDSLGYRYEVDENGDYVLTFKIDGRRNQWVYVFSSTTTFGSLKIREIWSPAYRTPSGKFSADVANRLLEDSHTSKLGGWIKQGRMAVFVVKIAFDALAKELDDALEIALRSADEMEITLTEDKDEF